MPESYFIKQYKDTPLPKFRLNDYVKYDGSKDGIFRINNFDYNKDIRSDTFKIIGWEYCLDLTGSNFIWRVEDELELVEDYKVDAKKYNL